MQPKQQQSTSDSGNMMDRWLNESMREQPYHGIGSVAAVLDQFDLLGQQTDEGRAASTATPSYGGDRSF